MAEKNAISQNDQELLSAKAALRKYYKWRFGELPPEGWQADHQVEQNTRFADYFGTDYVHNIANIIFVPGDVNADKNRRYQRSWKSAPKEYRELNPLVLQHMPVLSGAKDEEPQLSQAWVRDGLYQLILSMDNPQAFSFLFEFSKDMLMDIIRFKEKGIWKARPPQWLVDNPKWLDRLKDEVWFHSRYVSDYFAKFPQTSRSPVFGEPSGASQEISEDALARMFGYSVLPDDYRVTVVDL